MKIFFIKIRSVLASINLHKTVWLVAVRCVCISLYIHVQNDKKKA